MNNMTPVRFDNYNRPIIWQDGSNRLWTYYGNDMMECDIDGNVYQQQQQDELIPIEYDRMSNPIKWQDNYGRVFILDGHGNLVEDIVAPISSSNSSYGNYTTPRAKNRNIPGANGGGGTINKGDKSVTSRFKNVEKRYEKPATHPNNNIRRHNNQQQQPQNMDVPSLVLIGYSVTGKYTYYPLVDESMYAVSIEIDEENRTYSYKIRNKG